MGPSFERWHHERSEKRPLYVKAVINWLNKMPHLSSRSSVCRVVNSKCKNYNEMYHTNLCSVTSVQIKIGNGIDLLVHRPLCIGLCLCKRPYGRGDKLGTDLVTNYAL